MGFWDTVFINPMLNGLILLERLAFNNFGLAIILFTVIVRLVTLPLMLKQLRETKKMSELGPKIAELQKKYKDPRRRQEETMKIYKEHGVNPIGCLGPMVIQFPIWIALYRVISLTAAGTPERTVELAHRLYPLSLIQSAIPFPTNFLWLDLGRPDPYFILFVLAGVTTFLQSKLSTPEQVTVQSAQQASTSRMLLYLMPVMFAWFTISVPSGLSVYWVANNIIGAAISWFVYGWSHRPLVDVIRDPYSQAAQKKPVRRAPRDEDDGDGEQAKSRPAKPDGGNDTRPIAEFDPMNPNKKSKRPGRGDGMIDKRNGNGQFGDDREDGGGGGRESAAGARARTGPSRRRRR